MVHLIYLHLESNKSLVNIKSKKTETVKNKLYNRRLLNRISRLNEESKIYKHTEVASPNELTRRSHVSASIPIIKLRKQDFKESDPKVRENIMFSKYIERKYFSNRRCNSGIRLQSKQQSNEYTWLISPSKIRQAKARKNEWITIDSDEDSEWGNKILDNIQLQIVEVSQVIYFFTLALILLFSHTFSCPFHQMNMKMITKVAKRLNLLLCRK